ncbi:MAG TPA: dephospho-CoA kinase [Flavobacteriales bacterium]|nr:dephospho-CoA kinase [Flavobacteriales bacterium]
MIHVGLTGGIGSGKSTVAAVLRVLEVPVFDADGAGKDLLDTDPALANAVKARFGDGLYRDGRLDRKALADIVFADPKALSELNALVHPAVRRSFQDWIAEQKAPYVVMEAAILAETGGYAAFDRIIAVSAPEDLRVQRVMRRDGLGEEAVRARLRNQTGEEERSRIAHHMIHNDDRQLVIPQVLSIHAELLKFANA